MARYHIEEGNNDWMYWVLGIGAAWYLYSSGFFTTLMNSFGTMLPSASPVVNSQGQMPTVPQQGITQVEPTAVYSHDVNVSSVDQYSQ